MIGTEQTAPDRPYEVTGDYPAVLGMVLCRTACQHAVEPAATSWDELSSMGCPGYRGWAWIEELAGPGPERGRPMTGYRMIMVWVVGLCALAAVSRVWPEADVLATVVLAGLGACGVLVAVVVAVRRERRIRDRASTTRPGRATDTASMVPAERVAS